MSTCMNELFSCIFVSLHREKTQSESWAWSAEVKYAQVRAFENEFQEIYTQQTHTHSLWLLLWLLLFVIFQITILFIFFRARARVCILLFNALSIAHAKYVDVGIRLFFLKANNTWTFLWGDFSRLIFSAFRVRVWCLKSDKLFSKCLCVWRAEKSKKMMFMTVQSWCMLARVAD